MVIRRTCATSAAPRRGTGSGIRRAAPRSWRLTTRGGLTHGKKFGLPVLRRQASRRIAPEVTMSDTDRPADIARDTSGEFGSLPSDAPLRSPPLSEAL
jgi:hypothetical protein